MKYTCIESGQSSTKEGDAGALQQEWAKQGRTSVLVKCPGRQRKFLVWVKPRITVRSLLAKLSTPLLQHGIVVGLRTEAGMLPFSALISKCAAAAGKAKYTFMMASAAVVCGEGQYKLPQHRKPCDKLHPGAEVLLAFTAQQAMGHAVEWFHFVLSHRKRTGAHEYFAVQVDSGKKETVVLRPNCFGTAQDAAHGTWFSF